jgi:hypothetical protein
VFVYGLGSYFRESLGYGFYPGYDLTGNQWKY